MSIADRQPVNRPLPDSQIAALVGLLKTMVDPVAAAVSNALGRRARK